VYQGPWRDVVLMPISICMSPKTAKTLTLVLALALAVVATESASARTRKRVEHPAPPSLMLDSGARAAVAR
jgi:hypothetical protein